MGQFTDPLPAGSMALPARRGLLRYFERFVRIGSATVLARELRAEGVRTKRGKLVRQGIPLQAAQQPDLPRHGSAQGHGTPGRALGDHRPGLWDKVHAILAENVRTRSATLGRRRRHC